MATLYEDLLDDYLSGIFSGSQVEALAAAAEMRSRTGLVWELFIPAGSTGVVLISEAAFRALTRWAKSRIPDILLKLGKRAATSAIAASPAVAATTALGPAAPGAATAVLTGVEVYAALSVLGSQAVEITRLYTSFPTENEAVGLLPAEYLAYDQAKRVREGQLRPIKVSAEDVALATAYFTHCASTLPPNDPRMTAASQSMLIAWRTGLVIPAYRPLIAAAKRRLKPYIGSDTAAVLSRMTEFAAVYAQYGGHKLLKKGKLGLKLANSLFTGANFVIAADNVVTSFCRDTQACPYLKVVAGGVLDFMMSPSSYEFQLPWRQSCPPDSVCVQAAPDVDPSTLSLIEQVNLDRQVLYPVSQVNRATGDVEANIRALEEQR